MALDKGTDRGLPLSWEPSEGTKNGILSTIFIEKKPPSDGGKDTGEAEELWNQIDQISQRFSLLWITIKYPLKKTTHKDQEDPI